MADEMAPPRGPVGRACSLAGWGFLHSLSATHRKPPPWAWAGVGGWQGVVRERWGSSHHETAGIQTGPDQAGEFWLLNSG